MGFAAVVWCYFWAATFYSGALLLARDQQRKHAGLSANIYSVFNKKYFDAGQPEYPEDVIQQHLRNFRIKLRCRF